MFAAPLLMSNDLRAISPEMVAMLTNKEARDVVRTNEEARDVVRTNEEARDVV